MGDLSLRGVRRAKSPPTARTAPSRPCQKAFQRVQTERAVGRRHSPASGSYPLLCTHLLQVGLRGFHDRRILAEDRRLADLHEPVHRPGPRRPGDGRLATKTPGGRPDGPGAPLRPRCDTSLFATGRPCPSARRSPRWVPRRTPMTTPWLRRSTRCTRPSSSATKDPGRTSTPPVVATAEWVHWAGTVRPHSAVGMRTPAEHEAAWAPTSARTARNNHNQQPPASDKPATTKPEA